MSRKLIFDIGMHVGQDAEFYVLKGMDVIAVEANPLLCEEVAARLSKPVAEGQLKIHNVGIAKEGGILDFFVNDTLSHWSSFDPELGSRLGTFHTIPVQTRTLSSLVLEHGLPYYMKIDIEGMDVTALEDVLASGMYPRFVSVENPLRSTIEKFTAHGYDRFKLVNQAKVPEITLPIPSLEGNYVDWTFPLGASGPFGKESPGDWLSASEASLASDNYWATPGFDPTKHGWYDLHASRA